MVMDGWVMGEGLKLDSLIFFLLREGGLESGV